MDLRTVGGTTWKVACQYGLTSGTIYFLQFRLYNSSNVDIGGTSFGPGGVGAATENAAGKFRATHAKPANGAGAYVVDHYGQCQFQQTAGGTVRPCVVDQLLADGSTPQMPFDYYPGGSPGDGPPVACATGSPSPADVGESITFNAACSSNATSYSWRRGSLTSGTVSTASSWSRSFATVGEYHYWLTATNATASSSVMVTVVVGEDDGNTSNCGAWWHLICHVKAALTAVFVPSNDVLTSQWNTVATSASTHWPLGPVLWGLGALSDFYGAFTHGCNYGANCPGSSQGLDTDYGNCASADTVNHGNVWGPGVTLPDGDDPTGIEFHFPILPCPGSDSDTGLGPVRTVVHSASSVAFILGFVLVVLRLVGIRIGGGKEDA